MTTHRCLSLGAGSFLALAVSLSAAPESDTRAAAYRVSIAQDEVSKKTDEVHKTIQLVLQDFYQNHLQSTNANEAKQVAEQLSRLNDDQIKPLVDLLREIGTAEKEQAGQGRLESASKAQKEVQVRLKTLENNLLLHIDQASIRQRFVSLAQRQAANLRQTRSLASATKISKSLQAVVDLSQNEQIALGQEVGLALEALKRVATQTTDASRARFVEAWQSGQQSGLAPAAVQAGTQLSQSQFAQAMASESLVFDALQTVTIKLEADASAQERLQAMKSELDQMAAQQKALAESTGKGEATDATREEQAKLADQVAMMKADLKALNVGAAGQLEKAAQTIDQALDKLGQSAKGPQKDVAALQNSAAQQMEALGKTLDAQMKQIAASTPKDAQEGVQSLADLDQQIRKLAEQQAAAGADPQAQQKLAAQAASLQQQAAGISPQAAQDLGAAAAQMGKDPAAAAQSLAQARTDLMQEIQTSSKAVADSQQLNAVAGQLAQALAQSEQASQAMGQGAGDMQAASQQMQQAQQSLQKAQAASGAGTPSEAQQAMEEAQKNLQKAQAGAAKKEGAQAAAGANSEAQKAIQKAQSAVGKAQADAKSALAGAPGSPAAPGAPGAPGAGAPGAEQKAVADTQVSTPPKDAPGGASTDGQSGGGMTGGMQNFRATLGNTKGVNAQVNGGLGSEVRETLAAFRKEKAPAEYQGMVQQYLLNLADGTTPAESDQPHR